VTGVQTCALPICSGLFKRNASRALPNSFWTFRWLHPVMKFFGNTFITGCSHLNGICACSYSFELYVAAQRCSLREDLPASGKQSNHCWHFDRTAVRPPQMNVDIARTVSVRCTGVRRGRLRENRIGERRSREETQENKILRDAEDLSEKPAQVCATSCATFLDEPQCPDTCQNDQRPHPLELHS